MPESRGQRRSHGHGERQRAAGEQSFFFFELATAPSFSCKFLSLRALSLSSCRIVILLLLLHRCAIFFIFVIVTSLPVAVAIIPSLLQLLVKVMRKSEKPSSTAATSVTTFTKSQEQQGTLSPPPSRSEANGFETNTEKIANIQEAEAEGYSIHVKGLSPNTTPSLLESVLKKFGLIKNGGIQVRSQKSMRLYPQPPVLIRRSLENDMLGEYPIKRGEDIFISVWNLHRSPNLWDDADKFQPERWPVDGPNPNETNQNFRYLPFGGGPRKCIGDLFASNKTIVAFAMLVRRFNFQRAVGAPPASPILIEGHQVLVEEKRLTT
ncbi:9-beta-pimara-7,15-diene oxidase-like [Arachis stenosperma]|uniref:9-beta-pimara-7,15-diene oxidase-like n=1 Tax=Arachis stenosperma TaxID=217475 RepID=UPI0025AD18A7|nr:9-beta-pimara-7,15-diene oxidase-like [Arachis stenosperma]